MKIPTHARFGQANVRQSGIRSVTAGRARLSSARRATIWGVRRRAEDRRALPPALTDPLHKAPVGRSILQQKRQKDSRSPKPVGIAMAKGVAKRLGLGLSFCRFCFEGL